MFLIILLLFLSVFSGSSAWNVTCDLDLEGIAEIIEFLPTACQEIYRAGPDSELYQASLDESRKFAEFFNKLEDYERKETSTPANEIPRQNTKLRFGIYNSTRLNECARDIGNRTDFATDKDKTIEYYNCLFVKRDKMIELIPK